MAIGNWGTVIKFEVSTRKMLTFQNMKRSVSGRWESHSILNQKPKGEFKGPEASSITMDILLSAGHGVSPRVMLEKLEAATETGIAEYLYIGGKKVGNGKMVLESVSETWDEVWNNGELVKATASLTFSEYS